MHLGCQQGEHSRGLGLRLCRLGLQRYGVWYWEWRAGSDEWRWDRKLAEGTSIAAQRHIPTNPWTGIQIPVVCLCYSTDTWLHDHTFLRCTLLLLVRFSSVATFVFLAFHSSRFLWLLSFLDFSEINTVFVLIPACLISVLHLGPHQFLPQCNKNY